MPSSTNKTPVPKYSITTPRLYLQPLTVKEHLDDFHEIYSRPESSKWSTSGPKKTIEEARATMLSRGRSEDRPWVENYAMLLRPEASSSQDESEETHNPESVQKLKVVGLVGSIRKSTLGIPELGYRLHPDFWGRGLATEGVKGFLDVYWGLEERKDVQQVEAVVDLRNEASMRVMEKVGARKGEISMMELERLGKCEMQRWIIDRPTA